MHGHDWQAGFTPVYLSEGPAPRPGTILTIHNMAFHGMAPASAREALRLPAGGFVRDGYEFWGHVSALKAVLPHDALVMAVGGVGPAQMRDWWTAGCRGFGIGGDLFKPGFTPDEVRTRAEAAVAAVRALMG